MEKKRSCSYWIRNKDTSSRHLESIWAASYTWGGGRKEEKEEGKDGEERVREKGVEFCTTIPSAREEIRWRNICTVQFV